MTAPQFWSLFQISSLFQLPVAPKLTDIETWAAFFIYFQYLFAWLNTSEQPSLSQTCSSTGLSEEPSYLWSHGY